MLVLHIECYSQLCANKPAPYCCSWQSRGWWPNTEAPVTGMGDLDGILSFLLEPCVVTICANKSAEGLCLRSLSLSCLPRKCCLPSGGPGLLPSLEAFPNTVHPLKHPLQPDEYSPFCVPPLKCILCYPLVSVAPRYPECFRRVDSHDAPTLSSCMASLNTVLGLLK